MFDRPLHPHLTAEGIPVEEQRGVRVCLQLVSLAARVVREEDEAGRGEGLHEDHTNRRGAGGARGGEGRGLRFPHARPAGVPEPRRELTQRVAVDVLLP